MTVPRSQGEVIPGSTAAAVLTAAGQLEDRELELAQPGEGEVLVQVRTVGLCGSDIHWFEEGSIGDAGLGEGLVLGHEFTGVIESGPRAGQRVAVDPAIPCLVCEFCGRNQHHLCADLRFAGHGTTHGALRTRLVWPDRCLVSLPDEIDDEVGALLEPLGVALHAVDRAGVDERSTVGIVGTGPIGLLIIVALQARGITSIVATDPLPHRRRAAESLGAVAHPEGFADANVECEVVFDAAGSDSALATALDAARPRGVVIVVGIPPGDFTTITASAARRKELTLKWSRRMRSGDLARAASLAADRTDALRRLVTHRYPFGETKRAFDDLVSRKGIKVLVTHGNT